MNKTALISVSTVISSLSLVAIGINPAIAQSPTLESLRAGIINPQPSPHLLSLNNGILAESHNNQDVIQNFSQSSPTTLAALEANTDWQANNSQNIGQDFPQGSPATLVASSNSPTTLVALEANTDWQLNNTQNVIQDFAKGSPVTLPALEDDVAGEPANIQNISLEVPQSIPTTLVSLGNSTSWQTNAAHLRDKLDQDSVFDCPAGGQLETVWGSGVYSDMSSVCSAAVHAGVISAEQGGTVTIRTRPAQTAYASSERNGVMTESFGSGQGSFVFLSSAMPINEPIDWEYGVADLRGRLDQSFTFTCMPNGRIHNVWGSDLYTDDSSVCSAAVHAGLINTREGGTISIRMISGQGAYTGTSRNGVSTIGYGNWHGSYIFLR